MKNTIDDYSQMIDMFRVFGLIIFFVSITAMFVVFEINSTLIRTAIVGIIMFLAGKYMEARRC